MSEHDVSFGSSPPGSGATVGPPQTKRSRAWLGLLGKTSITLLFVGLAPLVAFGVFTLSAQRTSLRVEAQKSMQSNAESIASLVDEWFDKNARVLRAAANQPQIIGMQRDEQSKVLLAIKRAYPWMYLVFTIGVDGKNVARSDEQPLIDYSERQYFRDIVSGGKELAWEAVLGKTSGKPSLLISIPIRGANGQLVGVLAAGMTIEETSRSVANWKSGNTGFAFLVDEKSKVLAHPRPDFVLAQRRLADHPMVALFHGDHRPHLTSFLENGKETLGYVQGDKYGWAVVVQQEEAELFGPLLATITVGIGLLVAAALLVVAASVLFSRARVRPIVDMTIAADRMSLGELQTPIVARGKDEISVLAKSLERVRKSMRAAMARLTKGEGD